MRLLIWSNNPSTWWTANSKKDVLAELIRSRGASQVLVFTRTKLMAARLSRLLEREGITAESIHGDKSQQERIKALDAFKEGRITALVATDVAARGLDIDDLPLVVNYELPPNAEDYVHRIGRTGRAGASGEAISLVDPDEERLLLDIEKTGEAPVRQGKKQMHRNANLLTLLQNPDPVLRLNTLHQTKPRPINPNRINQNLINQDQKNQKP